MFPCEMARYIAGFQREARIAIALRQKPETGLPQAPFGMRPAPLSAFLGIRRAFLGRGWARSRWRRRRAGDLGHRMWRRRGRRRRPMDRLSALGQTVSRQTRDEGLTGCVVSTSERWAGIAWLKLQPAAAAEAVAARGRSEVVAAPDERSAAAGPAGAAVEAPASPLAVLGAVAEVAAGPAGAAAPALLPAE